MTLVVFFICCIYEKVPSSKSNNQIASTGSPVVRRLALQDSCRNCWTAGQRQKPCLAAKLDLHCRPNHGAGAPKHLCSGSLSVTANKIIQIQRHKFSNIKLQAIKSIVNSTKAAHACVDVPVVFSR